LHYEIQLDNPSDILLGEQARLGGSFPRGVMEADLV
jgi:hypothetical protein